MTLEFGDLVVAGLAHFAEDFGAEVRVGGEVVGEAEEVREEGEGEGVGGGGGGGEAEGEVQAFAGVGFVEAGWTGVSGGLDFLGGRRWGGGEAEGLYLKGLSIGWSVTMRYSKSSPACATASIRSFVSSASVISALSLITVVHPGSLG